MPLSQRRIEILSKVNLGPHRKTAMLLCQKKEKKSQKGKQKKGEKKKAHSSSLLSGVVFLSSPLLCLARALTYNSRRSRCGPSQRFHLREYGPANRWAEAPSRSRTLRFLDTGDICRTYLP
ncbi:hypothetical protein Micbo1qcDRAFT_39059 [Microdochium bolleyi]|uniref:Uncharacterized protein n=1 Tax=Microdochium bolleyi TaxID=196109 RepID=A0A136J9L6_9PEZI|nr:hypothetical protein Micbo1qcDRAFT_39059 [Microdochium bolleyi]